MRRLIVPATAILLGAAAPAQAEITQCTNITTLPTVISTQGVYCLKQDLSTSITSGPAIRITANNVTLDCNDWKIGGLAGGIATNAAGVWSTKLNTTIRNCSIRGFKTGIALSGSGGYLVEDNRLDHNTEEGIFLGGDANVVRRNRIIDTGGRPLSDTSIGIMVSYTTASVISDNLIANVTVTGNGAGQGSSIGLWTTHSSKGVEIRNNTFSNIVPAGNGRAFGTLGGADSVVSVRDNTAFNPTPTAGAGFDGGDSASLCKGNISQGFTTTIAHCTDAGGNVGN